MPATTYQQILNGLSLLDRKELEDVRRKAAVLLQLKGGGSPAQSGSLDNEDWLLEGIKAELYRRGLLDKASGFRIKGDRSFGSFQTKSEKVRELLEKAAPDLSLTERHYLGQIAAKQLARYIESWNAKDEDDKIAVSLTTMLRFVDRVPEAIETYFPGYMGAQLLAVIITHKL